MAPLEWKESYSVGVTVLDADHLIFMKMINRLDRAGQDRQAVRAVLQDLAKNAAGHFEREEIRMEVVDYPGLTKHVREHKEFGEWLDSVAAVDSMTNRLDPNFTDRVNAFLHAWWEHHVLGTDQGYKPYLGSMGADAVDK